MREYEVMDELVKGWLSQVEGQLRLARFFDQPEPIMIHADRVNIVARKVNVLVVKDALSHSLQILKSLEHANPALVHVSQRRSFWEKELHKAIQKASLLPPEARDEELQKLAAEAEEWLQH